MNRFGRIALLFLLSGALLLSYGLYAQDKETQDAPADKQQDSGNRTEAPDPEKCPALECLPFRSRATKPGEQRVHGCRRKMNQETDPDGLLQREDWLPERE